MTASRMSRADAAWLRMDRTTNLMVIHGVLWLETPPDWEAVKQAFQERILDVFPRFSRRPRPGGALRGPVWEDAPLFDQRAHFHHIALPAPGDRAALEVLVGDLASQPLDHDRPLWEAYLVDGYGAGAAILMRIHHAVADGIALARVMLSLTDEGADAGLVAGAPQRGSAGPFARVATTGRCAIETSAGTAGAVLATARNPVRLRNAATRGRRDVGALAKLALPGPERSDALKPGPGVVHRAAWSAPYDLWRVKATGRALHVTVNDVLVAAVSGALARRTADRGSAVEEVHALVPFNLRPLDQPVPRDLGNRFGLVLLALPVHAADPLERLLAVKRSMQEIKASDEGVIAYAILDLIGRMPGGLEPALIDYFTSKASLVLTNVPGPRKGVRLAGVRVGGVLVWAPCSGSVEMSVSLFSYAGKVTVGFLVDAALEPEPAALAEAVRDELRAYARLARRVEHAAV